MKERPRKPSCILRALFILTGIVMIPACADGQVSGNGTYKIVVNGYDWGPAVDKAIVTLNAPIDQIDKDSISLVETKKWHTGNRVDSFKRTVTNAYLSDENGNKVDVPSKSFALELYVSPNEGSPFLYNNQTGYNSWDDPYYLTIKITGGATLKSGGKAINRLNIDQKYSDKIMPSVSKFSTSEYTSDNITLQYAYYVPRKNNDANPLLIWLHGAGEGGKDTSITILANKVTALISEKTQELLQNAYVLVPQAETFWMDNGTGNYTTDGTSKYSKVLMSLIESFVSSHPDINPDKIIVGGCSNGGFMTLKLLFERPDYFSAAFPVAEAYNDTWISDDMIQKIKNVPIWFVHAKNDTTVPPYATVIPTYERLKQAGAGDIHLSLFDNVVDTSGLYKDDTGNPYEYSGHMSWLYVFNNECADNKVQLFEWASSRVKARR